MADWFKAAQQGGDDSTSTSTTATAGAGAGAAADRNDELPFCSRRSPVVCRNGCVSSSQPLASSIGVDLLRQGANAADAAVAVAAALAVTEPCSTGLGGDMFCLYYDSATRRVSCINGSGKSPAALNLNLVCQKYPSASNPPISGIDADAFCFSPLAVTVPGAAQGWQDLWQRHGSGKFTMSQLVEPAAQLAEQGFPVAPLTSHHWREGMKQIKMHLSEQEIEQGRIPLTVDGKNGPQAGDIIVNKDLARVFRDFGELGAKAGFYEGTTGKAIVDTLQALGGCMTLQDLSEHTSTFPKPISMDYRGCRLWQVPPNGQGVAGLIALAGLQRLEDDKKIISPISPESMGTAEIYHAMIEMMRLGFADGRAYVADVDHMKVDMNWLVDKERIGNRAAKLFDSTKAAIAGVPDASSCTVSFQVVDGAGNAISFVNSNFIGFGTGIIPKGCGFTLQCRGFGFTLQEGHPNSLEPSKRPYHTIIPGMLTHEDTNELYATISNMGGNMQPQGHFQLTVDLLAGNMDPQVAIDMPRFCIADGTQNGIVFLEKEVDPKVVEELKVKGHRIKSGIMGHARSVFGRAQIIKRDRKTGVLWAGSDGRADGCAMGF